MPVPLLVALWGALFASGGVLSGILYEKNTSPANPVFTPATETEGKFDFFKTLKLIAIITAGGVAIHLLMKLFKIKLFGNSKIKK